MFILAKIWICMELNRIMILFIYRTSSPSPSPGCLQPREKLPSPGSIGEVAEPPGPWGVRTMLGCSSSPVTAPHPPSAVPPSSVYLSPSLIVHGSRQRWSGTRAGAGYQLPAAA